MMCSITSHGGSRARKTPLTKQTDFVALTVVLHEELVPSPDMRIEVPEGGESANRRAFEDDAAPCHRQICGLS